MTPEQIALVRFSFSQLASRDEVAALFYARLFILDPALRGLFTGNMDEQRRKLGSMIALAVNSLDRPDALRSALDSLGQRHLAYGVAERHYDTVGAALVAALEIALGKRFTPEIRAAWLACYALLAGTMKAASRAADAAPSPSRRNAHG
jgi:nitric oxide dioxygenase